LATIRKEMGSTWKASAVVLFQTGVAWIVAFIFYNIGKIIL
jgi:Fe2+ transport system protein B